MEESKSNWNENRPYYMLYQDKMFLKNIYAQLNIDLPDVGMIAYIGANTHRESKDYSFNGEHGMFKEKRNEYKNKMDNKEDKFLKNENREKAGVVICDTNETSEIREYANISEIKEMNNMLFYRYILRKIVETCGANDRYPICYINDEIKIYSSYEEKTNEPDVFVKMGEDCIWLKRENMDTSVLNMANMMGKVCMVGYVIEEKSENKPRVIKAIAIYT